jgi:hypothetical protein
VKEEGSMLLLHLSYGRFQKCSGEESEKNYPEPTLRGIGKNIG